MNGAKPEVPTSIIAVAGIFAGSFMLVSYLFGTSFWLTPAGMLVAFVIALIAVVLFFLVFRRQIRRGLGQTAVPNQSELARRSWKALLVQRVVWIAVLVCLLLAFRWLAS